MMKKLHPLFLIPALLLPVAACDGGSGGDSEDAGTGGGLSYASDVEPIFVDRCVAAGCHDSGSQDVSLAAGEGFANIVDQASSVSA